MNPKLVLDKKRTGHALGTAEIRDFIRGYAAGEIPDCQMSALAMAVCCRGMNARETADLTAAMLATGITLEWEYPTADKHSTGGVGDKLSLVVQPLAAAAGLKVPSLAGRGLGLTGGTIDKLESIPGFTAALDAAALRRCVGEAGLAIAAATEDIAPADRKLYALRDVTGTVASIPLIVASILSKKLAEGAGTLVFDIKCGRGAFMQTREEAGELARALVDGARAAGRRAAALVTAMDAPLGRAVGNANEVAEALAILRGEIPPARPDVALSIELAAHMVALSGGEPLAAARERCRALLADGSALERFRAMVAAQGGDLDAFERRRLGAAFRFRVQAMRSGWIAAIDAEKVARTAFALGAGRSRPGDTIEPFSGVDLAVGVGDRVVPGSPLATLVRERTPDGLESAAAELLKAFTISGAPVEPPASLILETIA